MNAKKIAIFSTVAAGLLLGAAGPALASAGAEGVAAKSPGVISGNLIEVPIHIPANVCGDTIDVIGILNPDFGNTCIDADAHVHHHHCDHECSR